MNYTVTKKEFLAVVHGINKFWHYITGYDFFIHTDHSAIRFLMKKLVTTGRITRWILLLQEFNITIVDRPGKENVVVDFLSRIPQDNIDILVNDNFPDIHLFVVAFKTPCFADTTNYLATGRLPTHLSSPQKRRIVQQSAYYSWVGSDLFYKSLDMIIRRCVWEDEIPDIC
jgi:hypothetical protein